MSATFLISIDDQSSAGRAQLATSLSHYIQSVAYLKQTEILRERHDSQDAGSLISIVLGAPALTLVIRAIGTWLSRENQASVTIMLPDKTIVFKNMDSSKVADAILAMQSFCNTEAKRAG